jgi:phosphoribosyl-ATP pyrophosphohydrolase/phosphoribosyl-AMP cyclohydrolase
VRQDSEKHTRIPKGPLTRNPRAGLFAARVRVQDGCEKDNYRDSDPAGQNDDARSEMSEVKDAPKIDFAKMDGLVPGIVQDAKTGEMLMLGFLNEVSYAKTLESGFVTFWSRTRQKLWMKGETSGNRLRIISAATDCDNDALLFKVEVEGDGLVCHEGTVSCFTKPITVTKAEGSK